MYIFNVYLLISNVAIFWDFFTILKQIVLQFIYQNRVTFVVTGSQS